MHDHLLSGREALARMDAKAAKAAEQASAHLTFDIGEQPVVDRDQSLAIAAALDPFARAGILVNLPLHFG